MISRTSGLLVAAALAVCSACTSSPAAPSSSNSAPSPSSTTGTTGTTAPPTPGSGNVAAVTVAGTAPAVGNAAQFTATAALSDTSSRPVTADATWQSSNPGVATVTAGMVTGVAVGEADISATYQNVVGKVHVTIAASPKAPTPSQVSVGGTAPTIGATTQFSAVVTLSDNTTKEVTNVAIWHSSNTAIATVNSGQVRGIAAGQADITADYGGVVGTLHITIASSSTTPPTTPPPTTPPPAPAPSACVFSVFPQTVQMPSGGGTTTLSVLTGNGCAWTATSSDPFMTITSAASGVGSGILTISVAPDPGAARAATLTVGDAHVPMTQAGGQAAPNCGVALLPAGADYSAEMKEGFVTVTAGAGCQWTATTTSPFIILNNTGPASGTGNGGFVFRLFGNLTGAPRSASIKVGQQTFTISQRAALGGTSLSFVSDPGDYVGQGWTVLHEAPTSTFTPSLDPSRNHVSFRFVSSDGLSTLNWSLDFAAPQGQQLTTGTYLNATRYPFQAPTVPGIDFSGDGRGCNQENGQFTITDFAYGSDGVLQRLTATFEQHCEGGAPALRGKIVYVR